MINKDNFNNYFNYSKDLFSSILFIFPLLIIYEFLCFLLFRDKDFIIRNSADVYIRNLFKIFSNNYEIIYILFLIIIVSFYILFNYIKYKDFKFKYHYNILMIAEGVVYGLLLIILINGFEIFNFNFLYIKENIFLHFYYCLGAGVWEEIFFRLFIFNILFYIFSKFIFNIDNSYILAILLSSILFSYFHYIGNFADTFTWSIFIIRFIAGIYLCIIYLKRGLGLAVMTHYVYDLLLIILPII